MSDQPTITAEEAAAFLPEALRRPPIFDLLNATPAGQRQLQLIRTRSAKGANDAEVAQFLELCSQYGLDWNAQEAWCAVAENNGRRSVLLMVGRNGLRKVAQRQGLDFDGDVVRANDTFKVTRKTDRTRSILHAYEEGADAKARGPILGAWCEVYEVHRNPLTGAKIAGRQRGFFYAPLSEYRPTSEAKLKYSPWGSQESVMILAAAERQALGQATPLGGIVAQGELDRGEEQAAAAELTAGVGSGEAPDVELPASVEAVIARARALGHAGLANREAAALAVGGQSPQAAVDWIRRATEELNALSLIRRRQEEVDDEVEVPYRSPFEPPDAEVVTATHAETPIDPPSAPQDAPEAETGPADHSPPPSESADGDPEPWAGRVPLESLRAIALQLADDADAAEAEGKDEEADRLRDEAGKAMNEADALADPGQGDFGL